MAETGDSQDATEQRRVLLADRDPNVCWALGVLLGRERGLVVAGEAPDAASLLASTAAVQPHLVLLDWDLPGLRADGGLQAVRARCPGVTIIALSARPERRQEVLLAGAEAFVSKVDPPDRLLAKLRDVLAGSPPTPTGDPPTGT